MRRSDAVSGARSPRSTSRPRFRRPTFSGNRSTPSPAVVAIVPASALTTVISTKPPRSACGCSNKTPSTNPNELTISRSTTAYAIGSRVRLDERARQVLLHPQLGGPRFGRCGARIASRHQQRDHHRQGEEGEQHHDVLALADRERVERRDEEVVEAREPQERGQDAGPQPAEPHGAHDHEQERERLGHRVDVTAVRVQHHHERRGGHHRDHAAGDRLPHGPHLGSNR